MTAIEFNNISKQYRLGLVSTRTLSNDLNRWWTMNILHKEDPYLKVGSVNDRSQKADSEYVWALKNIDFKVDQGDVLGIIGKNGAGKSTLLKLLSRVTAPTTGTIRAQGRIASLLEVGTGFHPELTGRENIYMNGAILGMSKSEITQKLDEIIDFAGVERYIDTPTKRYSSGMTVRLGFAIAAHLDPEILVVDEVLAVGDAEFQKKAIGKMKDVSSGDGRTVLFVSHNMNSVKALCTRGVVLKNGMIDFSGGINDSILHYINVYGNEERPISVKITDSMRDKNRSMSVRFISISHKKKSEKYATDENIVLNITIEADREVEQCRINCTIYTDDEVPICNNSSNQHFNIKKGQVLNLEYELINPGLALGKYLMSFSVGMGNAKTGETNFDVIRNVLSIDIFKPHLLSDDVYMKWDRSWGQIVMDSKYKILD